MYRSSTMLIICMCVCRREKEDDDEAEEKLKQLGKTTEKKRNDYQSWGNKIETRQTMTNVAREKEQLLDI